MIKKNGLTVIFLFLSNIWFCTILLMLGQNDINKKLPITTNCEMTGLGVTKATIIDRPKKMIIIKCVGGE